MEPREWMKTTDDVRMSTSQCGQRFGPTSRRTAARGIANARPVRLRDRARLAGSGSKTLSPAVVMGLFACDATSHECQSATGSQPEFGRTIRTCGRSHTRAKRVAIPKISRFVEVRTKGHKKDSRTEPRKRESTYRSARSHAKARQRPCRPRAGGQRRGRRCSGRRRALALAIGTAALRRRRSGFGRRLQADLS